MEKLKSSFSPPKRKKVVTVIPNFSLTYILKERKKKKEGGGVAARIGTGRDYRVFKVLSDAPYRP